MSAILIVFVVLAVGVAIVGLQVVSLHIHRFPTDVRRPGPLIRTRRSDQRTAHAAELRRFVTVISYAVLNDRSARAELAEIFADLDGPTSPLIEAGSTRRDHRRRSEQIEHAIAALERRWTPEAPPTS